MGTDSTSRTIIILAAVAVLAWAVWLIRDVLPPFLIAGAVALLLDPLLERMQRIGLPRWVAVALTSGVFLALFVAVMAFVVPRVVAQVAELLGSMDAYGRYLQESLDTWGQQNARLLRALNLPPSVAALWQQYQGEITRYLQVGLRSLFGALQASAGALGWMLVVPVVTLYLLMDMGALKARLFHLVSAPHRATVVDLCAQVGNVFAAYLRGLTLICAAYGLGVYLVLVLGFELQYALILAILGGVLYAVPYLGQLTLIVVCCIVAWATGRNLTSVILVGVSLLVVGQLFDQLITPRVIGKQVGLHPVLGLFALMVGGHLFGLFGMVIAVPVAASARIVLIHVFPRLGEPLRKPKEEAAQEEARKDGMPIGA